MNQRLTRRRFGQLVLASTTVAALGYFEKKTSAQTANLDIISVSAVAKAITAAEGIVVQSLDVALSQVETITLTEDPDEDTAVLEIDEELTGLTSLGGDGTLVVCIAPVRTGKKENEPTRLVFAGKSPKTLTVSGLKKQDRLDSLLGANDGSLLGLVSKKNRQPPVNLVKISPNTGEISLIDKIKLPQTQRFSNLAQCPNGTIYTTAISRLGETSLVRLDLAQGKAISEVQLNFKGTVWNNGLSDLVCSEADQLFALGAPRYVTPNNLYTVNSRTGAMTLLRQYDANKITISSG